MKERPILFTPENAQKVHLGTKTQTRRVVKIKAPLSREPYYATGKVLTDLPRQPGAFMEFRYRAQDEPGFTGSPASFLIPCPFGTVGEKLWVRETFRSFSDGDTFYKGDFGDVIPVHADDDPNKWKWQPCLHMPRKLCRTVVELTAVRVERLQKISEEDCQAEGIKQEWTCINPGIGSYAHDNNVRDDYRKLWESINGAGSWALNPWVWALEFKRLEGMR